MRCAVCTHCSPRIAVDSLRRGRTADGALPFGARLLMLFRSTGTFLSFSVGPRLPISRALLIGSGYHGGRQPQSSAAAISRGALVLSVLAIFLSFFFFLRAFPFSYFFSILRHIFTFAGSSRPTEYRRFLRAPHRSWLLVRSLTVSGDRI